MRIHPPRSNPRMSTWSRPIMIQIPTTMIQMTKSILPQEGLRQRRPHPKLVPKSPPPALRLVSKVKPAPKNILDEETESDNHPGDRPALPRRPAMRPVLTSNDRWFVTNGSDTDISLQKESVHPGPFGNSKFLNFVYEYYKECSTILDVNPDFHFIPEHERPQESKYFG